MNNHNEMSYEELTQISNASESLWRYVPCVSFGEKLENELDLEIHYDNNHTEELKCKECSYKTSNQSMMENHIKDIHPKNLYQKRIKQNLLNVDLEEESDDDYQPSDFEEETEENDNLLKRKRKKTYQPKQIDKGRKKHKSEFVCNKCHNTFSRKDSLNRHEKLIVKNK